MWTSERRLDGRREEAPADLGMVTLGGDPAGVYLGGERRWVAVYAPGGYQWRPKAGDQVLVVKGGAGRESPCLVGTRQKEPKEEELKAGEVKIQGGRGEIHLCQSGVALRGGVTVDGEALEGMIERIVVRVVSAMLG